MSKISDMVRNILGVGRSKVAKVRVEPNLRLELGLKSRTRETYPWN